MKILFICKYNRFRSRVAETYLKEINKKIKIKSAGIIKGKPTPKTVIKIAKTLGIKIKGKPKPIKEKELESTDKIIITANDVPPIIFKRFKEKLIIWKIPDTTENNTKEIKRIIKMIIKKVDNLNKTFNKIK